MGLTSLRKRTSKITGTVVVIAAIGMLGTAFTGLGLTLMGGGGPSTSSESQSLSDVIATLNKQDITRGDFEGNLHKIEQQGGQTVTVMNACGLNAEAMDQTITYFLMLQIARSQGIRVTDADMDTARKDETRYFATEVGLKPTATLAQVDSKLQELDAQTIEEQLPDDALRQDLLHDKFIAAVRSATPVTAQDVQQEYTDLHTLDIQINNPSSPDAQQQLLAQNLIARLNKGDDFAALAKQFSNDFATKSSGGDSWVTKSSGKPEEYLDAARALKVGQITEQPVAVPHQGYYIIKLLGTRSSMPKSINMQKEISDLQDQRVSDIIEKEVQSARDKMKLTIKDPRLRLDYGVEQLYQHPGGVDQTALQSLINGYVKLAAKTDSSDAAQIWTQVAQLYGMTNADPKTKAQNQINAYLSALKSSGGQNPDLDIQIGELYAQQKENDDARTYFQQASTNAGSNPQIHGELYSAYMQLGDKADATAEMKLAGLPTSGVNSFAPRMTMPPTTVTAGAPTVAGKAVPAGVVTTMKPGAFPIGIKPGAFPAGMKPGAFPGGVMPGGKPQPQIVTLPNGKQAIKMPGGKIIPINFGPAGKPGKPMNVMPHPAPFVAKPLPNAGQAPSSVMFQKPPAQPAQPAKTSTGAGQTKPSTPAPAAPSGSTGSSPSTSSQPATH